jgi:AcrR family transcriptional regulator
MEKSEPLPGGIPAAPEFPPNVQTPRDEAIVKAAFCVFSEKGFHGATMLEVASRARASKATLYDRFHNKEGLFYALLEWGSRQSMSHLQSIAEDCGRDPKQALIDYAVAVLDTLMRPEVMAMNRMVIADAGRRPEIARIFNRLTRERGQAMLRPLVERLKHAGYVAFDDPAEFGGSFVGLLRGDIYYRVLIGIQPPPPADEIDRLARNAVTRVLRAFAPR